MIEYVLRGPDNVEDFDGDEPEVTPQYVCMTEDDTLGFGDRAFAQLFDARDLPAALREILGPQVFTFGFPTEEAALRHAADRMAQGRPAVTYSDPEGGFVCSYGLKGV